MSRPAISMLLHADGDYVVAWHSNHRHGSTGINAQRYTAAGGRLGGELPVNTR